MGKVNRSDLVEYQPPSSGKVHPYQEFEQLMRDIRDRVRGYPQEALEDIFLYLDLIERKDTEVDVIG